MKNCGLTHGVIVCIYNYMRFDWSKSRLHGLSAWDGSTGASGATAGATVGRSHGGLEPRWAGHAAAIVGTESQTAITCRWVQIHFIILSFRVL